ncbi:MAG: ribonuclease HI family protein [Candidatus Daviesbacteria bacterium]
MQKLIINTDGGSRNNPGKAAAAFIVSDEKGKVLFSDGKYLGIATNNEAEYIAVRLALEWVLENLKEDLPLKVDLKADSQLIVQQLSGNFKVKNNKLKFLFEVIKNFEEKVGEINYQYVPRSENWKADALVNQILDKNPTLY